MWHSCFPTVLFDDHKWIIGKKISRFLNLHIFFNTLLNLKYVMMRFISPMFGFIECLVCCIFYLIMHSVRVGFNHLVKSVKNMYFFTTTYLYGQLLRSSSKTTEDAITQEDLLWNASGYYYIMGYGECVVRMHNRHWSFQLHLFILIKAISLRHRVGLKFIYKNNHSKRTLYVSTQSKAFEMSKVKHAADCFAFYHLQVID